MSAMRMPSLLLLISAFLTAQSPTVTGRWFAAADFYGTPIDFSLELNQEGDKLTGNFAGDKLEGTLTGNSIHFLAKDEHGGSEDCTATIQGDTMSGTVVFIDGDDPAHPSTHAFIATLTPQRGPGPPQRHEFIPTTFY